MSENKQIILWITAILAVILISLIVDQGASFSSDFNPQQKKYTTPRTTVDALDDINKTLQDYANQGLHSP